MAIAAKDSIDEGSLVDIGSYQDFYDLMLSPAISFLSS